MQNEIECFVKGMLRPTGPAEDIAFIPHPEELPVDYRFALNGDVWCVTSWQQRTKLGYKICVVRVPQRT